VSLETISRRRVFSALSTSLVVAPAFGATFHRTPLNIDNHDDAFVAYLKMRGSFSTDPVYWWYKSLTYGVMDRDVTLLYSLEIATYTRNRLNDDGTMTTTSSEVGYFLSPEDGRVLETMTNPYTGKSVRLGHIKGGPREYLLTPDGMRLVGGMPPGTDFRVTIGRPFVVNGVAYLPEEAHGTIPSKAKDVGGAEVDWPFRSDEFATYSAPLDELNDAATPTATSTRFTFQNMLNWPVWMDMGTRPGFTMGRGQGGKIESMQDLPASIRKPIADRDPVFYETPESWVKPEKHVPIFGQ